VLQRHGPGLRHLLHEVAEAAGSVLAFGERGVELQQCALEETELRGDLPLGEDLQRTLHERQHLRDVALAGRGGRLASAAIGARLPGQAHQVLVGDELVTVPLHRQAGELAPADDDHPAAVLLQLLDERDEVAIAADDDEGVDVVVGEGHLERVERHGDVGAILVAAGREIALDHPDRMLREQPAVIAGTLPVAVGDLGDNLAALLDGFEHQADVELAAEGGFDADLDVVEVDENGNSRTGLCEIHYYVDSWLSENYQL
jgi:hypothetical protein